jgi:hypothetical protein
LFLSFSLSLLLIPVVVVAVVMWKSATSISKVCWEGWEKQSHRFFQALQQTVISTASVPRAQLAALLSGTGSRFFLASSIR